MIELIIHSNLVKNITITWREIVDPTGSTISQDERYTHKRKIKMYNKEFKQDKDYPKWNPEKTEQVPERPNWENDFGKNKLSFSNGSKNCYINEKKFKRPNIRCGDYTIQVKIPKYKNYQQITDKEFISILKQEKSNLSDLKKKATENFANYTKESELLKAIDIKEYSDIEKTFLNYAWHRCIIEERLYQQPYYGGSTTFLSVIK